MANDQLLDGAHFSGTIAELPVADLIQMLLLAGKQAVITVARDGVASQVWCAAGEIVDAESGLLKGALALYRILGFEHGSLVAALRPVPRERSISGNPMCLLLEGARRKDESDALRARLGGEQCCYQLASGVAEPEALSALAVPLLRSLAEARSVSQVLASSEQGELETLTLLADWVEAGVLVGADTPPLLSVSASEASIASRSSLAVAWGQSLAAPLRQVRPLWLLGVLAALVLVPVGYLLGAGSARTLERRAAGAPEAALPSATVAAEPSSYAVQIQVEPAEAQIALDGEQPVKGHLEAQLLRNGLVHELRVTAAGFLPTSIRFLDAAPPPQLRLEPLELPVIVCKPSVVTERPKSPGPRPAAKRPQRQSLDRQEPVIEVIH